jgi:hypothetical protein
MTLLQEIQMLRDQGRLPRREVASLLADYEALRQRVLALMRQGPPLVGFGGDR